MAQERSGVVTFRGNPVTLVGQEIKVGQTAPSFSAVGQGMSAVSSKDYAGKVKIVVTVPSLDTPVCSTETQKFNQMASALSADVQVIVASMDLPFAQARWCGANNVDKVQCISDFKERQIGAAYGVQVKELGLLTRAVFVVDKKDVVRHVEYVPEVGQEPNYEAVQEAVRKIAG